MNRLDELINELCPDGVKKVAVGSFAKVQKVKNKDGHCDKAYSITKNGLVPTAEYFKDTKVTSDDTSGYRIVKRNWFVYSPSRIDVGSINFLRDADEVIVSPLNVVFSVDTQKIYPEYLLYYLQSWEGTWQIITSREGIEGTGRKLLPFDKFAKIEVPVPPLEIQKEIIFILTNFTEFIAELTAELTARKKQYEYYRDLLLTFDKADETVLTDRQTDLIWISLSDLFYTRNGYTPSKNHTEYWTNGSVPWFRMEDIRENGRILSDAIQKVSESAVKGQPFPQDSIIVATSATIGEHALITVPSLANQRFTYLMLKEEYKELVNMKFIYYYCFKLDDYCRENLNQGNFASVDMKKFAKFIFPIPSLEIQCRIVSILDRFDTLCNDLSSGLPAEIEARQKQYEYYRDKLLTFKLKKAAGASD